MQCCLLLAATTSCCWPRVSAWAAWWALACGEALDPALQPSRGPGSGVTSFGSTCITACVIDSKEHSSAATEWLKGRMGGRLILAIKSQDMTLPLRHLCNYFFQCFYFCDINLRKRLGSLILCLPASFWGPCCSFPGVGCPSMTALLTQAKQAAAPTPHHMQMWLCMYTHVDDIESYGRRWLEYGSIQWADVKVVNTKGLVVNRLAWNAQLYV